MTIGATDGNIIAASITTQVVRKNPSGPGSVQRPMSIPDICPAETTQLTAARESRTATRPAARTSTPKTEALAVARAADLWAPEPGVNFLRTENPRSSPALRGTFGHFACEAELGALAVDTFVVQAEETGGSWRLSDHELVGEAEHRILNGGDTPARSRQ